MYGVDSGMSDDLASAVDFIKKHDNFLLSTHVNPDGDGLGGVMALSWLIEKLGKKCEIIIDSEPPVVYDFFTDYEKISRFDTNKSYDRYDAVIIADAPGVFRLGDVAGLVPDSAEILIIDHHPTEKTNGTCRCIDTSSASTTQIVLRMLEEAGFILDKACAEYLYTGILIDTGRFRFSNTSPDVMKAAGKLLETGLSPDFISERLFYHNTYETTKALGKMLDSIELHHGGKIASSYFTLDTVMSEEFKKVDTEGFVNRALAIQGVEVAFLAREIKKGVTRASLRAKHDVDVNKIANQLGGGGHAKAAGCTIEKPLEPAIGTLVAAFTEVL